MPQIDDGQNANVLWVKDAIGQRRVLVAAIGDGFNNSKNKRSDEARAACILIQILSMSHREIVPPP
jgi:hypothetical protein